jgi:lipid II:glycine glycyltransferase (peptidoglycan interpeptide bridge formation enzyme)
MPNATIELDTSKEPIKSWLSNSWKRYVNKWEKAWLEFVELKTKKDREAYREMRYKMWYDKRFNVVPKETFLKLMAYLKKEKKWTLFAAKKDKEIVSGAVYLYYGKQLVYLYGATDRTYGNIWAQYRLTFEIMKRANKNKRSSIDLLWVSPVWQEKGHDLEGVTRFKQVFGGSTISYVCNYDIEFNKMLYGGFKKLKGK